MIQLENINKSVGNFTLRDISLSIEQGSYTVILGDSGAGKSLLLEILPGSGGPDSGKILVDGVEGAEPIYSGETIRISVSQDLALFPHLSVRENIAFPLKMRRMSKLDVDQIIHELALRFEISQLMERFSEYLVRWGAAAGGVGQNPGS
jgi:molybdate/tungstate transport system ATP-binding protein